MDSNGSGQRTRPIGAEVVPGGVHFRVWAPHREKINVVLLGEADSPRVEPLAAEPSGYFAGLVTGVAAGARYFYRVDDDPRDYPDPASCYQPQGVHGPSQVIDPHHFPWTDQHWRGSSLKGQILYEMHIGTFTAEGNWEAAIAKLPHLADLGVTMVEVMPVAEFQGQFGWGYDGVFWYAPTQLYGTPDDFRNFVNVAHRLRLSVILDVVYNHFGPTGNYTGVFSPYYLSKRHPTEWGEAINYDGDQAAGVREFVIANAAYWIREFHLDGLRLDATQTIVDDSDEHILAALGRAARQAAGERQIAIFAEDERQRIAHVQSQSNGGFGLDGLWNDDFHHTCRVAATGHAEYYFSDYSGSPSEIIAASRFGYLYQGQWNQRQGGPRGTWAWNVAPEHFVNFLQNHDQVANSAQGWRGHQLTSPGRWRALTGLLLLVPGTPMLFMGQEFMSSSPFHYFADHESELAALVRDGRWADLRRFPRLARAAEIVPFADPADRQTFEQSKLRWEECERNQQALRLHRDLIQLRKQDPILSRQEAAMIHGAVLGDEAFLLRWIDSAGCDRLLLVNLGRDLEMRPIGQPLLAPPSTGEWRTAWSSESPEYGGTGTALLDMRNLTLPGHAAILLAPASSPSDSTKKAQAR